MSDSTAQTRKWTAVIILLLLSIGLGIAVFVYRSTTQVREALAEEVLQQQHDVSSLIQEYGHVMFLLERLRQNKGTQNQSNLMDGLTRAQDQLERMRSNYSFARLDGAAEAHAYINPILEDIDQWLTKGFAGFSNDSDVVLQTAANRLNERYEIIRQISNETDSVATELISEQTDFLENFRNSMLLLLAGFALLSLTIVSLLMRQRNLQFQLAKDQELNAQNLIEAETRGRQQAEEALLGSEQFLRATLDSLPSNIAILDNKGDITAANTPWKSFVSNPENTYPDGGIGHNYETVFTSTADSNLELRGMKAASAEVARVLQNEKDSMFYEYPCDIDNERRWFEVSMSIFNTAEGRHAVFVHEDITDRKQLEDRDRKLRAELAHVSRLTTAGELASGLAHELNQPLTAIAHNADAVISSVKSEAESEPELLQTLNDISSQAHRAGSIIRGMRHLVRKDTTDMVSTDINKLVEETVRLTGPEAREKGVNVNLQLAADLPMPVLDPIQIQQVLVNLERNGVEAMWQADSDVKNLTITTALHDNDHLLVSIRDTGPGVDSEFSRRLFTAFQTTKAGGMGLGLSISRTIVEEHGGRLWIDPDGGGDTIFHFTIPFLQE